MASNLEGQTRFPYPRFNSNHTDNHITRPVEVVYTNPTNPLQDIKKGYSQSGISRLILVITFLVGFFSLLIFGVWGGSFYFLICHIATGFLGGAVGQISWGDEILGTSIYAASFLLTVGVQLFREGTILLDLLSIAVASHFAFGFLGGWCHSTFS